MLSFLSEHHGRVDVWCSHLAALICNIQHVKQIICLHELLPGADLQYQPYSQQDPVQAERYDHPPRTDQQCHIYPQKNQVHVDRLVLSPRADQAHEDQLDLSPSTDEQCHNSPQQDRVLASPQVMSPRTDQQCHIYPQDQEHAYRRDLSPRADPPLSPSKAQYLSPSASPCTHDETNRFDCEEQIIAHLLESEKQLWDRLNLIGSQYKELMEDFRNGEVTKCDMQRVNQEVSSTVLQIIRHCSNFRLKRWKYQFRRFFRKSEPVLTSLLLKVVGRTCRHDR